MKREDGRQLKLYTSYLDPKLSTLTNQVVPIYCESWDYLGQEGHVWLKFLLLLW